MKHFALLFIYLLLTNTAGAAEEHLTQTIRGRVVDKSSLAPLTGVAVVLIGSNPFKATVTDIDGNFKLEKVPVGRQSVQLSYLGYKQETISNIDVTSGKEIVLNASLQENVIQAKEVTITTERRKEKPLNEMATVSARTFSVEETQKYAAAVNDPARMATTFAGVVSAYDGNNHIAIRGNSPNGLLWRMEGIDIPNPNHFSDVGTSGGGISILSAQLLSNSDFMTGAFAAEYGNALSGVFDLKLRKGNNEKHEFTAQLGVLGADIAAEGPFSKNKKASYLVNYRYSTLGLLNMMGINIGDGVTTFQDLSFNISAPTEKAGVFSLFGFGGISSDKFEAEKDSSKWEDQGYRYDYKFYANTGATGLTHFILLGSKTYLKSSLSLSSTQNGYTEDRLDDYYNPIKQYDNNFVQSKFSISSIVNHKFNSQHILRAGITENNLFYNLKQIEINDDTKALETKLKADGITESIQGFAQWQFRINEQLTLNSGFHYFQLMLNNSNSFEPRAAIKWEFRPQHSISLGYGLHSQMQPIGIYFVNLSGNVNNPNKNVGLTKAHHLVLGYDQMLTENVHLKMETYYQSLFNVPISAKQDGNFSMINNYDGFVFDSLTNKGTGTNYGLELTLEKFLSNNLYFMFTASLYESKYKGANGIEHNTLYNGNYATNFLAGKEITLSEKYKNRVLGFNIKLICTGGYRITPIDVEQSKEQETTIFFEDRSYELRNGTYFRTDIKVSLKRNFEKFTTTLSLDIQNVTNRKNVSDQYYNVNTNEILYDYQAPLIPILSYKVEF